MLPKGPKDSCFRKQVGRFLLKVGSCFSRDRLFKLSMRSWRAYTALR
jgi:hypothetical protein